MTKFLDGPAADVVLPIRRAPMFLRVVCSRKGEWDALDQIDDEPKPSETIHVYALKQKPGWVHLCIRGKGRAAGGYYPTAEYLYLARQPADADVRTTDAWHAWTLANKSLVAHLAAESTNP